MSLMYFLQVIVTETSQNLSFWAQHVDSGELLSWLGTDQAVTFGGKVWSHEISQIGVFENPDL